jgi:hypothetical protein
MVSPAASSSDLVSRIVRVLRLERAVFNEVEADSSATGQAWTIVIIAAISAALAGVVQELVTGPRFGNPIIGLVNGLVTTLIGFLVWALVVHFVGTRLFGGTASLGEMIRTLGFAYSPYLFGILGAIPLVGGLIVFILSVWSIITGYLAVREGLDLGNTKAISTIIISFVVLLLVALVLGLVFGAIALALGLGAATLASVGPR